MNTDKRKTKAEFVQFIAETPNTANGHFPSSNFQKPDEDALSIARVEYHQPETKRGLK